MPLALAACAPSGAPAPAPDRAPTGAAVASTPDAAPAALAPLCADPDCLPGFRLVTIDGRPVTSEDLRGKPALVIFWASWCEPCSEGGPALDRFYRRHRADGLEILAISHDEETDDAALRAHRDHFRLTYPIARSTEAVHAAFGRPEEIPTFFLYDRTGHRRLRITGRLSADVLKREVGTVLTF